MAFLLLSGPSLVPPTSAVLNREQAAWSVFYEAESAKTADQSLRLLSQFSSKLGRHDPIVDQYKFYYLAKSHRWDEAFRVSAHMRQMGRVSSGHLFNPEYNEIQKLPQYSMELKAYESLQARRLDALNVSSTGLSPTSASAGLQSLSIQNTISDQDLYRRLTRFSAYKAPRQTGCWFLDTVDFDSKTPGVGIVPVSYFVYIPKRYRPDRPNPAVIWIHGGFFDARTPAPPLMDINVGAFNPLLDQVAKRNYVEIMPLCYGGDATSVEGNSKLFGRILVRVKKMLNLDDDRVYMTGISDGGTSCFASAAEDPTPYASFYPVDGWPRPELHYLNFKNRPIKSLSAEKDDLFLLPTVARLYQVAQGLGADWEMNTVPNGVHDAKNFIKPYAASLFDNMAATKRDPLSLHKSWEADIVGANQVDWLEITSFDPARVRAPWIPPIMVPTPRRDKYYVELGELMTQDERASAVDGEFRDNTFTLKTSRAASVRIYIHPDMVDLAKPVRVVANGVEVFNSTVKVDRDFMLNRFLANFDRRLVWVNAISVKIP